MCVFFFQAEDGIRDATVTGVQTCALPILEARRAIADRLRSGRGPARAGPAREDLLGERRLRGVRVRDLDAPGDPVTVDEVDEAPVGEARDDRRDEGPERAAEIERSLEEGAVDRDLPRPAVLLERARRALGLREVRELRGRRGLCGRGARTRRDVDHPTRVPR